MSQSVRINDDPGFWMNETTGVLKPAVKAYLTGEPMTDGQIAAMRAYLRQWINAPAWKGREVTRLRREVDNLISVAALDRWLDAAARENIDPL